MVVLDSISTFTTIFLGIFIEAVPFLLLGTLLSGVVEVFLKQDHLQRVIPRNAFLGVLFGGVMGLFFPVCECGVVPFTRRLFKKGLPPSVGIAFLLAAPVLNPIVIVSTYAAFGFSNIFFLRIGLSLSIATFVGLIFSVQKRTNKILKPVALTPVSGASLDLPAQISPPASLGSRFRQVITITIDEFFEMGRFLVLGAMMAALMQTFIPQTVLLGIGSGPVISVLVMIALAVLLSICSTVDAFLALAFVGTFSTGSILAFLVFGPMVDIKSALMFMRVFRRRTVLYIILLPLLATIFLTVGINIFTNW